MSTRESTLAKAGEVFRNRSFVTTNLAESDGIFQQAVQQLITSKGFEFGITALIVFNVATIGVQADWAVKHTSDSVPTYFLALDLFFAVAFTVELALRLGGEGCSFFSYTSPNTQKNLFDLSLVIFALIEEGIKLARSSMPNVSAMRVVRVFRLIRVVRIVRVARIFSDLRVMVAGILTSLKSLMWASLLLLMMGYMFGVCVLELVSAELQSMDLYPDKQSGDIDSFREALLEYWGSLAMAVYTLFKAICGGVDWGDAAEPLIGISPFFGVLFSMYIAIAVFCVLNIITGVFVENTKSTLSKDETHLVMETIQSRMQWVDEVKALWNSFSGDCNEEIDAATFKERLKDFRVQALFERLGLSVEMENSDGLFWLLDLDGTGKLHVDEFAMGIQMLQGTAKNIDMARLRHMLGSVKNQLASLTGLMMKIEPEPGLRAAAETKVEDLVPVPPPPVESATSPPEPHFPAPCFLEQA